MIHAIFIWYGDILMSYALIGMVVVNLRNKNSESLFKWSLLFLIIPILVNLVIILGFDYLTHDFQSYAWKELFPTAAELGSEVAIYRGNYLDQLQNRIEMLKDVFPFEFLTLYFWRSGGFMILGILLFRENFFSTNQDLRSFLKRWGLGMGVPASIWATYMYGAGPASPKEFALSQLALYCSSIPLTLGLAAWIVDWGKNTLTEAIAAAGRLAFTLYISQSILSTLFFYGMGYFGSLPRTGQLLWTLGLWSTQVLFAVLYFKKFNQGPLEWVWRKLYQF